jgi:hypothetical protein
MMRFVSVVMVAALLVSGAAVAKPPLRDVTEIDEGLFVVGLAHEIHKKCPTISARLFRGIAALQDLKDRASDLGYSDSEIREHVDSKAEKRRLRARAADYMQDRGFNQTEEGYCALGRDEIAQKSDIGALLRAR